MQVHIRRIQGYCSDAVKVEAKRSDSPDTSSSRKISGHGAILDTHSYHQAEQRSLAHDTQSDDLSLATDRTVFGYTTYYETYDPHVNHREDGVTVSEPRTSPQKGNVEDHVKIPLAISSHRSSLAVRLNRECLMGALR